MKPDKERTNNLETSTVVDATPKENTNKKLSKKQKIIIAVVSIIVVIALIFLGVYVYENNTVKSAVSVKDSVKIEYGETSEQSLAALLDVKLIKSSSSDISNLHIFVDDAENPTLDTLTLGEHKGYVLYNCNSLFFKEYKYAFTITVQDTTSPEWQEAPETVECIKDCKEDFTSKYKATDLTEVTITIDDVNVDYTKAGEYDAVVFAMDTSGNVVNKNIKIKVNEAKVELNITSLTLNVGETQKLEAKITGKDQNVEWSSTDESIAKVENGTVTAVKSGTATIKAKANGVEVGCEVVVKTKETTTAANSTKTTTSSSSKNSTKSSSGSNSGSSSSGSNKSSSGSSGSSGTTTKAKYWCWEGGSHHVITEGIGWYSSYNEAKNAAYGYLSSHDNAISYEIQECDCGKYTVYIR